MCLGPLQIIFLCRVEVLSWKPRAFIYHNFLSAEECDHIIRTAKPLVGQLSVVLSAKAISLLVQDGTCRNCVPVKTLEVLHVVVLCQMRRSTVVGPSGTSVKDNIRTSYGTFLARQYDSVIEGVEKRLAAWTLLPLLHQEDMQVLNYPNI